MSKLLLTLLLLFITANSFAQNWDINTLRSINLNRNKSLDNTFQFISNSTSPVAFGIPIALFAINVLHKDSITKNKAIYIGSTVIISSIISTVSKKIIKRNRPSAIYPDIEAIGKAGSYSMPSGHTSDAFALATSVSVAYRKWFVVAPVFVWAGAVGYSRLHLGVHYPTDVLAGAVVGAGSAYLSFKLNNWLFHHAKPARHVGSGK
ncbi:MAG: phosphatase PAP2 family protein [Chitinophagaceae bacterium]|nr:phosphatase PAP2 family protein [Chitinophagaceae bacterium]